VAVTSLALLSPASPAWGRTELSAGARTTANFFGRPPTGGCATATSAPRTAYSVLGGQIASPGRHIRHDGRVPALARLLRPTLKGSTYVLVVAGVATFGFTTESTAAILFAAFLTLPLSVAAVPAYYIAYGLLAQLPGANSSSSTGSSSCTAAGECHSSSTGDVAAWFALTTDIVGVLALATAAVLNVVVFRSLCVARRTRTQTPPGPGPYDRPEIGVQ
jgi:hypothetical protein